MNTVGGEIIKVDNKLIKNILLSRASYHELTKDTYLTESITINDNLYFVFTKPNIIFDGKGYTITIDNVSNFAGLFRNGNKKNSSTINTNRIIIKNIKLEIKGNTTQLKNSGWICQENFGTYSSTNNTITYVDTSTPSPSSPIPHQKIITHSTPAPLARTLNNNTDTTDTPAPNLIIPDNIEYTSNVDYRHGITTYIFPHNATRNFSLKTKNLEITAMMLVGGGGAGATTPANWYSAAGGGGAGAVIYYNRDENDYKMNMTGNIHGNIANDSRGNGNDSIVEINTYDASILDNLESIQKNILWARGGENPPNPSGTNILNHGGGSYNAYGYESLTDNEEYNELTSTIGFITMGNKTGGRGMFDKEGAGGGGATGHGKNSVNTGIGQPGGTGFIYNPIDTPIIINGTDDLGRSFVTNLPDGSVPEDIKFTGYTNVLESAFKLTEFTAYASLNDTIYLPDTITSIGNYAFQGNTNLMRVIIEDGAYVYTVGADIFKDTGLIYFEAPQDVLDAFEVQVGEGKTVSGSGNNVRVSLPTNNNNSMAVSGGGRGGTDEGSGGHTGSLPTTSTNYGSGGAGGHSGRNNTSRRYGASGRGGALVLTIPNTMNVSETSITIPTSYSPYNIIIPDEIESDKWIYLDTPISKNFIFPYTIGKSFTLTTNNLEISSLLICGGGGGGSTSRSDYYSAGAGGGAGGIAIYNENDDLLNQKLTGQLQVSIGGDSGFNRSGKASIASLPLVYIPKGRYVFILLETINVPMHYAEIYILDEDENNLVTNESVVLAHSKIDTGENDVENVVDGDNNTFHETKTNTNGARNWLGIDLSDDKPIHEIRIIGRDGDEYKYGGTSYDSTVPFRVYVYKSVDYTGTFDSTGPLDYDNYHFHSNDFTKDTTDNQETYYIRAPIPRPIVAVASGGFKPNNPNADYGVYNEGGASGATVFSHPLHAISNEVYVRDGFEGGRFHEYYHLGDTYYGTHEGGGGAGASGKGEDANGNGYGGSGGATFIHYPYNFDSILNGIINRNHQEISVCPGGKGGNDGGREQTQPIKSSVYGGGGGGGMSGQGSYRNAAEGTGGVFMITVPRTMTVSGKSTHDDSVYNNPTTVIPTSMSVVEGLNLIGIPATGTIAGDNIKSLYKYNGTDKKYETVIKDSDTNNYPVQQSNGYWVVTTTSESLEMQYI